MQHQVVSVYDRGRKKRLSLEIFAPRSGSQASAVIFSHGRAYSPGPYRYLGRAWSARGFFVVMVHHRGRTESPAFSGFCDERVEDVLFVASQLNEILAGFGFRGGLPIGIGGHSLGAVTALMLAGARLRVHGRPLTATTTRGDAFLALGAPFSPKTGFTHLSWRNIRKPLFLFDPSDTATNGPLAARKKWLRQVPHKKKIHAILDSDNHYEFMDCAILDHGRGKIDSFPDPKRLRSIARQTASFWEAHLKPGAS